MKSEAAAFESCGLSLAPARLLTKACDDCSSSPGARLSLTAALALAARRFFRFLHRKSLALAREHDLAGMECLERAAMADRHHRGSRKLFGQQTIEGGFGGFVERGGGLVKKKELRSVQQRARKPQTLLFAERKRPVPVAVLLQARCQLGQAHRGQRLFYEIRSEHVRFGRVDDRCGQRADREIGPLRQ